MRNYYKLHRKLIAHCCFLLAAFLLLIATAHGQNELSGRVINVSHDSASVSEVKVRLQLVKANGQMYTTIDSTVTDWRGRFRFRNIKPDSQATYFPTVEHDAVRYFGTPANFFGQSERKESTVAVYDTTHSDADLSTAMHHMFVEMSADVAVVREVLILNNQGTRTILSAASESLAVGATIGFSLPHGARNVEPLSGFTPDGFTVEHGRLFDFGIIGPGTKQMVYAYRLPAGDGLVSIHRTLDYDTQLFDLFIADPELEVNSPGLQAMGPFSIRNTVYQRFAKENAASGERITITIRGAIGAKVPNSTPMIVVTILFLVAGVVIANLGRKKQVDVRNEVNNTFREEKQKLIILQRFFQNDIVVSVH